MPELYPALTSRYEEVNMVMQRGCYEYKGTVSR